MVHPFLILDFGDTVCDIIFKAVSRTAREFVEGRKGDQFSTNCVTFLKKKYFLFVLCFTFPFLLFIILVI